METDAGIVYRALRDPDCVRHLPPSALDQLFRRARRAGILSRLALTIDLPTSDRAADDKVADYLQSARLVAAHHERTIRWEVNRVRHALRGLGERIIVLKGAAYVVAELPARVGRLASDVDIMVPKARLEAVEEALGRAGWMTMKLDPYDQRYYRQWMHELPPLRHESRGTVLDVHHTILPESSRYRIQADPLFRDSVDLDDDLAVLSPQDMVLHSATHLFADGDLAGGLRELLDLDALFRHFDDSVPDFWRGLVTRSEMLGLERPLFYAVTFCGKLLDTPIPPPVTKEVAQYAPRWPTNRLMEVLAERAIEPDIDADWRNELALWMLYVRSHWLRMPAGLLMRHLVRKLWRRWSGPER